MNKKCPFCGSDPEIQEKSRMLRNKRESSARNIRFLGASRNSRGTICYYLYEQRYYIIRCSNNKCIAYHLSKSFWSTEDAMKEWNKRGE